MTNEMNKLCFRIKCVQIIREISKKVSQIQNRKLKLSVGGYPSIAKSNYEGCVKE